MLIAHHVVNYHCLRLFVRVVFFCNLPGYVFCQVTINLGEDRGDVTQNHLVLLHSYAPIQRIQTVHVVSARLSEHNQTNFFQFNFGTIEKQSTRFCRTYL